MQPAPGTQTQHVSSNMQSNFLTHEDVNAVVLEQL